MKRNGITIIGKYTGKDGRLYARNGQTKEGHYVTFWEKSKAGNEYNRVEPLVSTMTKRLKAGTLYIKYNDYAWPISMTEEE